MTDQLLDRVTAVTTLARPWGFFQKLVENAPVSVKVITVEPGHRLSLQTHEQRDEMWLVLDVPMTVTVDDREWRAEVGELVWVPAQAPHRMSNDGTTRARVVEVAFGEFDEDDIVRLQDDYPDQR